MREKNRIAKIIDEVTKKRSLDNFMGEPVFSCQRGRHWKIYPNGIKLLEGACSRGCPNFAII